VNILTKVNEKAGAWYPYSVSKLDEYIGKVICSEQGYEHYYALRRNIVYNLQYMEFQDRVLQDLKLSSVIKVQTIKTMILIGCGIIESILHFLLIKTKIHSSSEWRKKTEFKGNQKKLDGKFVRIDTIIYEKLESEELKHMTFDAMIKCAKSHNVLGKNKEMYEKLETLRVIRNKVHLQVINNPTDTDWNTFRFNDLSNMFKVLFSILVSSLFSPNDNESMLFEYMRRNIVT